MKHTRLVVPLAALAVIGAGATMPAMAAKPKFAGSYKLTLEPDPSPNVLNAAGMGNCQTLNPKASDRRTITVPAAGKFKVVLDSPDPTGRGVTDWDMWLLGKDGELLGKGTTGKSFEEVNIVLKKAKTPVTIAVCNLNGTMQGSVTYTLK